MSHNWVKPAIWLSIDRWYRTADGGEYQIIFVFAHISSYGFAIYIRVLYQPPFGWDVVCPYMSPNKRRRTVFFLKAPTAINVHYVAISVTRKKDTGKDIKRRGWFFSDNRQKRMSRWSKSRGFHGQFNYNTITISATLLCSQSRTCIFCACYKDRIISQTNAYNPEMTYCE